MMSKQQRKAISSPLLDKLRGILHLLKVAPQPIKDGSYHLVPLCETLEDVFKNGLKQPNSWFGLNPQDYWSWIEPLQDYYFNTKQNPILRKMVNEVAESTTLHSLQGKGRCFLRKALVQKVISVPIEHLGGNRRLTTYWYSDDAIIANPELRETLMALLFELTELDFQLEVEKCSFLNETWTIPVFQYCKLAPIRVLDIKVGQVDHRAVIVAVEKGCLAEQAGTEVGDILDEVCGESVYDMSQIRLKTVVGQKSVNSTDVTLVKRFLPDGCAFYPLVSRIKTLREPSALTLLPLFHPSPYLLVKDDSTSYVVFHLAKTEVTLETTTSDLQLTEDMIDSFISMAMTPATKEKDHMEVSICVCSSDVTIIEKEIQQVVAKYACSSVRGCGRGRVHSTCFVLLACTAVHVCEAASSEMACLVCTHIGEVAPTKLSR
eukprot:Em0020g1061a